MRQILRQLLVGLHAEEVVIRQRAQRREVDARLFLPDPDEVPVRPGLRRLLHEIIFDAALQRADEAEQRMRNVFQIVRHGLRLRRLGEALKVRAVRDEARHLELTLTRAKFNELTADLVDRTMGPVRKALQDAGLRPSDLKKVLTSLTTRQREIVYYRYIKDMSIDEISKITDMNYQSVSNSIQRALGRVRNLFKRE